MRKKFVFILNIEGDNINIEHNCSSLLEFVGVIELMKSMALNSTISSSTRNNSIQRKEVNSMDPEEYLKWLEENTRVVECKGIKRTFTFRK